MFPSHLEDFTLGPWFVSGPVTLDEEQITSFGQQFDPQPFHTSAETAEGTFFGSLAASGWHTAAVTMRLMVLSGAAPAWGLVGRGIESLEWPRATRPGDALTLHATVLDIRPSKSRPEMGLVRCEMITRNQNDEIAQKMICTIVVPTRSA